MALMDFIKKQFIDVIHWTERATACSPMRYPMQDFEIQYGAQLTVRDSQMAVFVNEGKVADVFGPGLYKLTTQTLPVLTNLKNWDKLFESPFKSDVYFFSTRLQPRPQVGNAEPDHHPRQGLRYGAHARLRHLLVQAEGPAQASTRKFPERANSTWSTTSTASCAIW
jgi:membrane protease subunit (stomatin/prohibitin family)